MWSFEEWFHVCKFNTRTCSWTCVNRGNTDLSDIFGPRHICNVRNRGSDHTDQLLSCTKSWMWLLRGVIEHGKNCGCLIGRTPIKCSVELAWSSNRYSRCYPREKFQGRNYIFAVLVDCRLDVERCKDVSDGNPDASICEMSPWAYPW